MEVREIVNLVENLELLTKTKAKLDRIPACKSKEFALKEIQRLLDESSEAPSPQSRVRAEDLPQGPRRRA